MKFISRWLFRSNQSAAPAATKITQDNPTHTPSTNASTHALFSRHQMPITKRTSLHRVLAWPVCPPGQLLRFSYEIHQPLAIQQ
jgi:hypothetical protein